jgi:hypothetical protein
MQELLPGGTFVQFSEEVRFMFSTNFVSPPHSEAASADLHLGIEKALLVNTLKPQSPPQTSAPNNGSGTHTNDLESSGGAKHKYRQNHMVYEAFWSNTGSECSVGCQMSLD